MSRRQMDYENMVPVHRVTKADEPPPVEEYRQGRWPRAKGVFVQDSDGAWRVRLRCPDGTIGRFRSRRTIPAEASHVRAAIGPRKRFEILSRDGFRCRYCGRAAQSVELHVDHVIAISNGGTSDDANLVAACADCNLGKAAS